MPLSEHEQKLLDQMERALYAEDPGFATQMKGAGGRTSKSRVLVGALAGVVGLLIVLVGVNVPSMPIGVLGFLVMIAGAAWAFKPASRPRREGAPGAQKPVRRPGGQTPRKAPRKSSFMERLDDRWERRRRSEGR